jgi:uncharacterized membrane protein YhfC
MRFALLISLLVAAALCLTVPVVLVRRLRRQWEMPWRTFGSGALVFLICEVVLRQPLLWLARSLLQERLQASVEVRLVWLGVAAATAGLLPELGRCAGYRWWVPWARRWRDGVAFGAGYGGMEVFVFGGLGGLAAVAGDLIYTLFGTEARAPAGLDSALAAARQTFAMLPPAMPLLNACDVLASLPIHVCLSLMVLCAVTGGGWRWLGAAIGCHALWEFAEALLSERAGPLAGAAAAALFAALSAGLIVRWRQSPPSGLAAER